MPKILIPGALAEALVEVDNGISVCPEHPEHPHTLCGCMPERRWVRVDEVEGASRRWEQHMQTIVKSPQGFFYCIGWDHGLTENQENSYPWRTWNNPEYQDVRIIKVEPYDVITTKWAAVADPN
jgi:hypothetical protein